MESVGTPQADSASVAIPNADSTNDDVEEIADGESVKQNSMGVPIGTSLWWLVVLLAIAAETMRRLRKARDRSVEPAEIA